MPRGCRRLLARLSSGLPTVCSSKSWTGVAKDLRSFSSPVWAIRRMCLMDSYRGSRPTCTSLARDLIAVLDSLRRAKASFAGHSFAGSEMSILAARFPERVDRLIYFDSAFDYRQLLDRVGVATALGSPQPPEGTYNRNTVADWTLYGERSSGAGFPESEVRAMFRVSADGIVQGSATAPETLRAMLDGIEPAPLTKIRARTLAIYAAPTSAEVMYPSWYAFDDSARQRGRTVYAAVSAEHALQRARFKREVVGSRQVIITGARHYLFLTHPGEVAHEVLSFMLSN